MADARCGKLLQDLGDFAASTGKCPRPGKAERLRAVQYDPDISLLQFFDQRLKFGGLDPVRVVGREEHLNMGEIEPIHIFSQTGRQFRAG